MMDQKSRLSYIVERIEKSGSVSISELAESFGVSEMTVRRDLIELEKLSIVRRVHGGAVSFYGRSFEPPLISRSNKNVAAKQRIGKYAASMVLDGDSIAIDVGSTTMEMAMNLVGRQNLTILTPSLHIANLMSEEKNIRLILSGGIVRQGEKSLIGDLAYLAFREIFVDRLFLGVGGIDAQVGLTEFEMQDAQVKKEMIKSAKEVIVLADSSKFQQVAFSFIARLDQIDHLVSDKEPQQPLLNELMKNNVEIHVAGE